MAVWPSAPAFIAAGAPLPHCMAPLYNKERPSFLSHSNLAAPLPLAAPPSSAAMSSSRKNIPAANGFGCGSLTVAE
jgi:hypothetical protein